MPRRKTKKIIDYSALNSRKHRNIVKDIGSDCETVNMTNELQQLDKEEKKLELQLKKARINNMKAELAEITQDTITQPPATIETLLQPWIFCVAKISCPWMKYWHQRKASKVT